MPASCTQAQKGCQSRDGCNAQRVWCHERAAAKSWVAAWVGVGVGAEENAGQRPHAPSHPPLIDERPVFVRVEWVEIVRVGPEVKATTGMRARQRFGQPALGQLNSVNGLPRTMLALHFIWASLFCLSTLSPTICHKYENDKLIIGCTGVCSGLARLRVRRNISQKCIYHSASPPSF